MARKKSWKFSEGGGDLFIVLLFLELFLVCLLILLKTEAVGLQFIFGLFTVLLVGFVLFKAVKSMLEKNLWKIPRSWYESIFAISILHLLYGLLH